MAAINWYPGHMTKTRRMLQENLKMIDVVVEVADVIQIGEMRCEDGAEDVVLRRVVRGRGPHERGRARLRHGRGRLRGLRRRPGAPAGRSQVGSPPPRRCPKDLF